MVKVHKEVRNFTGSTVIIIVQNRYILQNSILFHKKLYKYKKTCAIIQLTSKGRNARRDF